MIKRIAVAIALTFAPAAFAQTYIVPDGDCGAITLHATRGTDFPNLGETIGADRVKDAYVYLPKQRVAVKPAVGPRSLDFNANVSDDGVVMAAVDFTPAVNGNETRTEHAKALIRCGAIALGVDPADEVAVVQDRERVVAVNALRSRRVHLDAVVEAEEPGDTIPIPEQRVERGEERGPA